MSRRAASLIAVAATVMGALVVPVMFGAGPAAAATPSGLPPIAQRSAQGVTADALPTVQIDGVVWSQAVVGNTVYAGGSFANARPAGAAPGTSQTPRNNLLSYDLSTGVLNSSFAPSLNAQAMVVVASPDGSRIYVGGGFTTADGQQRDRIAAYSTATGQLISSFAPNLDATVNAITATNTTVYVGGDFSRANGVARSRLAAFSAADGSLLGWAPTADNSVKTMVLTPDNSRVIVGGMFLNLNGSPASGLGALDATSGTLLPWAATNLIKEGGSGSEISDLSTDGTAIYGTGWAFGSAISTLEGSFSADPDSGAINWIENCWGDVYNIFGVNGAVYNVGHAHACWNLGGFPDTNPRNTHRSMAFTAQAAGTLGHDIGNPDSHSTDFYGQPAPSIIDWWPDLDAGTYTGQNQGAWSVRGNSQYVVEGGEFQHVNGVAQQGLVRFANPSIAPNKQGPRLLAADMTPNLLARSSGSVRVSWSTDWDRDDKTLTYTVQRNGSTVYTTTADGQFWNLPTLGFIDTGLSPGTTYSYQVRVSDPNGNVTWSNSSSITTPTTSSPPDGAYVKDVLNAGATHLWRLDQGSATVNYDYAGFDDLSINSGVSGGATGAILNDADTASNFNGTTSGFATTSKTATFSASVLPAIQAPNTFTESAWFSTTSTGGGKIVGFGNARTGNSTIFDRHIYMDSGRHINFGVSNGANYTITSPNTYNDGQWHQVVGTLSSAGMALYIDGKLIGTNLGTTFGRTYNGYWRVGGDSTWSGNRYFTGRIDDVAIYPTALTGAQIRQQYIDSGRTIVGGTNQPPTASFTATPTNLSVAFDGSGSSDPDGSVASYSWDFGDGSPAGSGATPQHTYASGGTYHVTLTVTDNQGATGTVEHDVTVTPPPNQPPTAAFTSSANGFTASFDGSGSSDPDGSVASYSWDFGDGSSAGSGATPQHTYAAPGTYQVTLTVTDNQGATGSVTKAVTVTSVIAADAFGRTTSSGWGTADTGGPWSVTGTTSRFSVGGGVGTVNVEAAAVGPTAYLNSVSQANVNAVVDASVSQSSGGGSYVQLIGRHSGTSDYRLKVIYRADGTVQALISKVVSGTDTTLRSLVIPNLTYTPGTPLRIRFVVSGTGTTSLSGTVWPVGTTEPASPQISLTDSTAALQSAGSFGIQSYVTGTSTAVPVVFTYDNLSVTAS